jgi:dTDP-D-glucose 4,6-dehydratase
MKTNRTGKLKVKKEKVKSFNDYCDELLYGSYCEELWDNDKDCECNYKNYEDEDVCFDDEVCDEDAFIPENKKLNTVWVLVSLEKDQATLSFNFPEYFYTTQILGVFKTREAARKAKKRDLELFGFENSHQAKTDPVFSVTYTIKKVVVEEK